MKPMSMNARIALSIIPYLMVVVTVLGIYQVDAKMLPAVKDFTVNTVKSVDGKLQIEGTLLKVRDCDFLGLAVYGLVDGQPKEVLPHWGDQDTQHGRGLGFQPWGPWTISIPATSRFQYIEITATHRCIGPWTQTARYTQIDLHRLQGESK